MLDSFLPHDTHTHTYHPRPKPLTPTHPPTQLPTWQTCCAQCAWPAPAGRHGRRCAGSRRRSAPPQIGAAGSAAGVAAGAGAVMGVGAGGGELQTGRSGGEGPRGHTQCTHPCCNSRPPCTRTPIHPPLRSPTPHTHRTWYSIGSRLSCCGSAMRRMNSTSARLVKAELLRYPPSNQA